MVDLRPLFDMHIVSEQPPEKPTQPMKYGFDPEIFTRIAKTFFPSIFSGIIIGGAAGVLLGIVVAIFARGGASVGKTQDVINTSWIATIIVCMVVATILIFLSDVQDNSVAGQRRRLFNETYPARMAEYREAMKAYDELMAKWPAELQRRQAYNAAVRDARDTWYRNKKAEETLEKRRKTWRAGAEEAYRLFFSWRIEFMAECVATYGPRPADEIDRLCKQAFPHSPISGDSRLGYLHPFAESTPEIAQIKHLLPREIAVP